MKNIQLANFKPRFPDDVFWTDGVLTLNSDGDTFTVVKGKVVKGKIVESTGNVLIANLTMRLMATLAVKGLFRMVPDGPANETREEMYSRVFQNA